MSGWSLMPFEIKMMKDDALSGRVQLPLDRIMSCYLKWIQHDEYAIIQNKMTGFRFASLQEKRGNRAFSFKHSKKNAFLLHKFSTRHDLSFVYPDCPDHAGSCVLFLTGSFNPHSISLAEAWERCRSHADGRSSAPQLFRARLRKILLNHFTSMGVKKEYLDSEFFLVSQTNCEAHESGFPHFHMVFILDRLLPVYRHESRKFPGKFTWRLEDNNLRKKIQWAWAEVTGGSSDSFMDVQAAVDDQILDHEGNSTSALSYCLKYSMKSVNCFKRKDVLTQSLLKFWNFRSIIGKKFLRRLDVYREPPIRHDEIYNELKLAIEELQALEVKHAQFIKEKGSFAQYDKECAEFLRLYPSTKMALDVEISRL